MKRLWLVLLVLLLTPVDAWPCDDSLSVAVGDDVLEEEYDAEDSGEASPDFVWSSGGTGSGDTEAEASRARAAEDARRAARATARENAEIQRQATEAAREATREALREAERFRVLSGLDQLRMLSAGEPDEQTLKKVVPARRDALIVVQNGNGSIRLIGWSRPEVAIHCTLDRNLTVLRASGRLDSSEIRIEVEPRARLYQIVPHDGQQPVVIEGKKLKSWSWSTGESRSGPGVPPPAPTPPAPRTPPTPPTPSSAPTPRPTPAPRPTDDSEDSKDSEDSVDIGPLAPEADLEIYVPRTARLNLETFGADVTTENLEGTIDINSLQGNLQLGGRFRRVDAECVSCDMEIGPVLEALRVSNITGNVSALRLTGVAEISTVSGDMDLAAQSLGTGTFSSINGNIQFNGSVSRDGALFFETHDGSVNVGIPRGLCAEFDLTTILGELSTDMTARQAEESTRRDGRRVRFVTCGGGSRISAKSFSGDITVNETRR